MSSSTDQFLVYRYGSTERLPETRTLRAGPLELDIEGGDVRYIRLGDVELVRRIYVAVRDRNWNTIAPVFTNMALRLWEGRFELEFDCSHRRDDVAFSWHGTVSGDATGRVTYTMDGVADATFLKNRIGICLLHPDQAAGMRATVGHVDGAVTRGSFPLSISPHQPFYDIRWIAHEAAPSTWVKAELEGETFEMEDQRNWTDGSFKTYSTPLSVPYPAKIEAGTRIFQRATLTLESHPLHGVTQKRGQPLRFETGSAPRKLPEIGLAMASHSEPLTATELQRLAALGLSHLRIDVDLRSSWWEHRLLEAHRQAHSLGAAIQVGAIVDDNAEKQFGTLAEFFRRQPGLLPEWRTFFVFHSGEKATATKWIELARKVLGSFAPRPRFGGGTQHYFTELNRNRPVPPQPEWITWTVNPQVHAFDNLSIMETPAAQAACVKSARGFLPNSKVAVGPVTLKPRSNPNATSDEAESWVDGLPPYVDRRQPSMFCAAWTLGSINYLSDSGAESITYFETTGWLGVMETLAGSGVPAFHSFPGGVYPVYHVLADVGRFRGGTVSQLAVARPNDATGILLEKEGRRSYMVANLSGIRQEATLCGLHGRKASVRSLSEVSCMRAMKRPEEFRSAPDLVQVAIGGEIPLTLEPYALVTVEEQ